MKEIKATAPTREELYQEYKRLREDNERLKEENGRLAGVIDGYRIMEKLRKMIDSRYNGEQNK